MTARCDYHQITRNYPWVVEPEQKCIISSDLDGVFSFALAAARLQWILVGVYTITDLWLMQDYFPMGSSEAVEESLADVIFLDHDINRREIRSLGHHMLRWADDTDIPDHSQHGSTLNPNLLRGVTFRNRFQSKYPFGTFHFLAAILSAHSLLGDFDPDDDVTTLLMHIDSSFQSAILYQENALAWLDWLGGSEERSPLNPICRRMLRYDPRKIIEQFRRLAEIFEGFGLKRRSQAAVSDPTDRKAWETVRRLTDWFRESTGWDFTVPNLPEYELQRIPMDRFSTKPTRVNFERVIAQRPFSYAIISTGASGLNYNWFHGEAPSAFARTAESKTR